MAIIAVVALCSSSAAQAEQHSSPSIDRLVQQLTVRDRATRESALKTLADSGKDAVPALIEMLGADDRNVRKAAVEALRTIGAPAAAAVPALREIVQGQDRELADGAREAIVAIRTQQMERQQKITVQDGRFSARLVNQPIELALEEISRQGRIAIVPGAEVGGDLVSAEFTELALDEALREILKDHDTFFYYHADRGLLAVWVYPPGEGGALEPVPPEAWASTKELEAELAAADAQARARAFGTLIERKPRKGRELVEVALRDEAEEVRADALAAAIDQGVELPRGTLLELLGGDPSDQVRFLALLGLSLANDPDLEAIARSTLEDESPHLRSKARQILRRLEPPKRPPAPAQPMQGRR